jgi:nucleoside-diphosphate kinase
MSCGPIVAQVFEGENVIQRTRELIGATNPQMAEEGTIRQQFGQSIEANSVHGSDSPETACREISFFFSAIEIVG